MNATIRMVIHPVVSTSANGRLQVQKEDCAISISIIHVVSNVQLKFYTTCNENRGLLWIMRLTFFE